MAKIPLQEQDANMTQVVIEPEVKAGEIHQRGVSSTLGAIDKGEDPAQAYLKAVQNTDMQGMLDSWNETTTKDRMGIIQGKLQYAPEEIEQDITDLSTAVSGPISHENYVETIKSFPSSVGKTKEQISKEAVLMQLRETMHDKTPNFDQMSVGDIAGDVAGVIVPKNLTTSYRKLFSDMGFIDNVVDNADILFDPTDEIVKLRNTFHSLDAIGKSEFLTLLADNIDNATDNSLIKTEMITSILGDDFDKQLSHIFSALETVDISLLTTGLVKLSVSLAKSGKILNTARRLGEHDLSAEIVKTSVENPEAAAKIGVTQADVADALNPLVNGELGNVLTGAPDDVAASITQVMKLQDAEFKAVTENISRHGVLDRSGMDDAMRNAKMDQLSQPNMIESSVNQIDETGFELSWTEAYLDTLGRFRKKTGSKVVDFRINDIGELKAPVDEWVDVGITTLDPNARMTGTLRKWFVSDVETMARSQEMTAKAFDSMTRYAFQAAGKLNKKEAMNVDHALQKGAKEARTYNYEELTSGVTGRSMSPKEAKAYIGTRNVVEKLYILNNKQVVDNYLAQGVKLFDSPTGSLPVRQYDEWAAANTAWKQVASDSHHILIPERGLTLKGLTFKDGLIPLKNKAGLTREMIQEAYEKGYVLARNHNQAGLFKHDELKTQWAFVKRKNVHSPRGKQVIHRIEGYMPKQRTGSYWFIKKKKPVGLSGAKDYNIQSTEAYSDTAGAAEEWVKKQSNPDDYDIVFDRELTTDQRLYDVGSTSGGMYKGARKSEELKFVGDVEEHFTDSFEAMQHYINHIGRQYPASLYRLGAEERLIKMANDLGITGRDLNLHNVLRRAQDKGLVETSKQYKMLKGVHDQISFVNMIPTSEELAMANRWRVWGKMLEGPMLAKIPGWNNVPKVFYQKAAQNAQPVDILRGITFNHLLGLYNPAQVVVQWSGSLVSFAIDPIGFPKHTAKMIGWGALDNIATDPLKQKQIIKWMQKNDLGDYADEYELWRKSGFLESVVQGNADYTSVFTKNLPYDAGVFRKVMANHTLFYKMGELSNTRTAFATSVSRYKRVHKVDKISPDDAGALEEIGIWAEKYRLNMSRANQSALNKGWKAAPLQFQQVVSKYYEKVLPKMVGGTDEFTPLEKARLFGLTTMATGAVGIPMGQFVLDKVFDTFGLTETERSEALTVGAKYGAIGWMNSEMLDLNVNFSDRMTLGGDIIKKTFESITSGKATWQWLGASGSVIDRYMRNGQYLHEAFDLTVVKNENMTFDDVLAIPAIIFEAASDIPTVTRNLKMYSSHLFANNRQFIKDGKYMWDFETMNKQTAFFAAAGFQPTEQTEMYELSNELRDSSMSFSTFGDTDADVILRIINTKLLTAKSVRESELYAKVINSMIYKYGPSEQMQLMEKIWDKTNNKQFDQNNLLYKFMTEYVGQQQEGLDGLSTLLSRKLQERK